MISRSDRSVFLIGFMASGKSTVGELTARKLGLPFRDLDREIERRAGTTIAGLFDSQGEVEFRRLESDVLRAVLADEPAVVATGGGTPCFGDNLARMRAAGLVVALTAPLEDLLPRVADVSTRPLLAQTEREIRSLFERREPIYRQAHACVRTDRRGVLDVARAVVGVIDHCRMLTTVDLPSATVVALDERSYPILVQSGSLARIGPLCRETLGDKTSMVGLVCDDNVAPLYAAEARRSLLAAGFQVSSQVVPASETSKSMDTAAMLCEKLAAAGLDRKSVVIALGGGVIGDLAGFVAATLYRGVRCVQVPTTLIAMTDSAIGGKTGVNLKAGKNLIGAFWQPSLVVADPVTLSTLPERERRSGFGELLKYGLLDSEALFDQIDALAGAEPSGEIVRRCAAIKAYVVSRDERETTGERATLNLGHTLGHAIEVAAGYGGVQHGEAVALGLIAACRVSAALSLCDPGLEQRVAQAVARAGLDADLEPWLRDKVLRRIGVDKKRTGSRIAFIGLRGFGRPEICDLDLGQLQAILVGQH